MDDRPSAPRSVASSMALIVVVAGVAVVAFAFTAGWLTPHRLTPARLVNNLAPPGGAAPGFRRNHAKGICFTGIFESRGTAASLSKAQMFSPGVYPVTGRFNLGTPDPGASDSSVRVRGLSLRVVTPDGNEWRSAMINAPFFAVSTPQAFYALTQALARKQDPDAMKQFVAAHPEFAAFGAWATRSPVTASYAQERYNSLNAFVFTDAKGLERNVRWSFVPDATPQTMSSAELKQRGANFLDTDIAQRVASAPQRWTMIVTVANPGDPIADPTKVWPDDRLKVEAGTLVVKAIEPEPDGPCRDINFDPTVLPPGVHVSVDPFPAARSAAYSVSFNRRTAEDKDYPHTATGGSEP